MTDVVARGGNESPFDQQSIVEDINGNHEAGGCLVP